MRKQKNIPSFFLYIFGFLLLLEWIWPIEILSETAEIWVFLMFLTVSFLLSLFQVPLLIGVLLKGTVIAYSLYFLYFEGSFFQLDWISSFLLDFKTNLALIFSKNWNDLSHLFKSFLFFLLLWLIVYLLHYWLMIRNQIFLFFFMTLMYITVLDTFTPYDASGAIVRTVLVGFVLMGILTFRRLVNKKKVETGDAITRKWIIPLSVMVVSSAFLGYVLPKADPIWPDPVPFIQLLNEKGGSGAKRVGYGEDDTTLGGSIIGDSTVVFRTEVESPHYWKVETKDIYTGKGWIHSGEGEERVPFRKDRAVPIVSFAENDGIDKTVETSTVYPVKEYLHVIYPLGIKTIQSGSGYSYEVDPSIEKIYSFEGSEPVVMGNYSVTFDIPKYRITDLKTTEDVNSANLGTEFISQYTQLPDHVPQRVEDLAVKLTMGHQNWYDQAKAVEQFLKGTNFSYDTKNVLVPEEEQDYVDQFLFETMRGYCDNFSTSMVVLLRSLDIPARWVKGYTEGEYLGMDKELSIYEITNNNAHSWVEVYFPQVGWISFEPTPGFTNDGSYSLEEEQDGSIEASVPAEREEQVEENNVETGIVEPTEENKKFSLLEMWKGVKEFFTNHQGWTLLAVFIVIGAGYSIYQIRVRWFPIYYIWKFKHVEKEESFVEAYHVLLKQLNRYGLNRENGQTLREYGQSIDQYFSTNEMTLLTVEYERYLYGNCLEKDAWKRMRELWENLIKRTMA
ncbi:transglutaminase [Bacillus sp. V3B]|uniref:transglutaminase TgpA family protein n=1 Tax=Bacillus sp. V3B TaxID=2804915 RepID=UPI0021092F70|nr:transglutaminase domain-containing protein [Bacillus sp. V3B]MCQ6277006.1 transglutaminase [Bacillus sp. V3B]